MDIKQGTIPHIFRNKYLRGASALGVSTTQSSSSGGGGGGSSSYAERAGYADAAGMADRLTNYINLLGNLWCGNTDITDISGNTAVFNALSAITADIDALTATTAQVEDDLGVGGDAGIEGDLTVSGTTTLRGDLGVGGDARFAQDVQVDGDTTVQDLFSQNITNEDTIKTKDLVVTGRAHFFELIIDKIKAAGGAVLLTPADGFKVELVEQVTDGYRLYWRSSDEEGNGIMNMWEEGDQAICQSFNQARVGVSYDVHNKLYWCLVTAVDEDPVQKTVSGETHDYHYIEISTKSGTDSYGKPYYYGDVEPEVGDEIAMLGYRKDDDHQRQSAIYLAAYQSLDLGLTAPLFAEYKGINDFNLQSHRSSYIDATGASFQGELKVQNGETVENYVNNEVTEVRNEFKFDIDGLTSRVDHLSKPNILPANDWKDADGNDIYQENDEEYTVPESASTETAFPPVMYLNQGNYTMSVYASAKYRTIMYGYEKDNLDRNLMVETMRNPNDIWHSSKRSQTTFHAPIDGYYQIAFDMMDESWTGDTPYHEYSESGHSWTIQTIINYGVDYPTLLPIGVEVSASTTYTPSDYMGSLYYTSSDPSVVEVDPVTGWLTTKGEGTATITATLTDSFYDGNTYIGSTSSVEVQTHSQFHTQLTWPTNPLRVAPGESTIVDLEVWPPNFNASSIAYASENPTVALVRGMGGGCVISGLTEGNTTIRAFTTGYIEGETEYSSARANLTLNVKDKNFLGSIRLSNGQDVNIEKRQGTVLERSDVEQYLPNAVKFTVGHDCTAIGAGAFSGCTTLVELGTYIIELDSIGNDAFNGCTSLRGFHDSSYGDYIMYIKAGTVGAHAFANTGQIDYLTVQCDEMGEWAFGHSGVIEAHVHDIETLPFSAFRQCNSLTQIYLSETVKTIAGNAIWGGNITTISAPGVVTIDSGQYVPKLQYFTLPETLRTIKSGAFAGSGNNWQVTVQSGVTTVEESVWSRCGITSMEFNAQVTEIEDWMFTACSALTSVTISETVQSIGDYVFQDCSGLTRIRCKALTAPAITTNTFKRSSTLSRSGILLVPAGSTGYEAWMDQLARSPFNWTMQTYQ